MNFLKSFKNVKISKINNKKCQKCILDQFRALCSSNSDEILRNQSPEVREIAQYFSNSKINDEPFLQKITEHQWKIIAELETRCGRQKYLKSLWKREIQKENKRKKKEREYEEAPIETPRSPYRNYQCSNTTMSNFMNHKLVTAMIFGQKLVLDCSYESEMTGRECASVAEQLQKVFGINRAHEEPFDLHFCSINQGSKVVKNLERRIPTIFEADFPTNLHEDCYLENFPRQNLVYLTPDSPNDLEKYNPDDIYILGGLYDIAKYQPYSYEKASRQKIRTAKLPLDNLELNRNGRLRSLEIHEVVAVLLDLKSGLEIKEAIKRNVKALQKYESTVIEINKPKLKNFKDSRLVCELWGPYVMLQDLKKGRIKEKVFTPKKHLLDIEDLEKVLNNQKTDICTENVDFPRKFD